MAQGKAGYVKYPPAGGSVGEVLKKLSDEDWDMAWGPGGTGGGGGVAISAGTNSTSTGTVVFANSNGVTFGMDTNGQVTGSVQTNYLTTAMASNRGTDFVQATAAFAGTNASGTIASNGVSVSVGNYITTARASNDAVGLNSALTAGPLAWTVNSSGISLNASSVAGTTSGFGGNLISGSMTHNTAGLNLSLNHPAWLTTAMQSNAATISNIRVSAGTTSNLLSALTFDNGNGITFGLNASTLTASHNGLTSQSNQAFSAAGGSSAFQTLVFTNSNGVSWTNTNGSVAASVATTYRASNDAVGLNTAQSNVTWTVNSSGLSLDARGYAGTATTFNGANISGSMTLNSAGLNLSLSGGGGGVTNQTGPNIAAGGVTVTDGTVVFSNSNGMVFGLAGSTMTASYNDVTESMFWRPNDLITTVGAPINASASVIYCPMDHNLSASRFDLIASVSVATAGNNSSAGFLYSATAVIYTKNGGTLSSVSSTTTNNQMSWTSNATGSVTGAFFLSLPLNVAAVADKYWVAVQLSTRATGLTGAATTSLGNTVSMMGVGSAIAGAFSAREPGSSTANSNGWFYGMGMYSGTSNFSTIGLSNLTQQGTNANRANVALRMRNV